MSTSPGFELERLLGEEGFVRKIARGLLFDEHEVDDVVQQTWLQAMRRPPREAKGSKTWLATVAKNQASNRRRSEGRRRAHEQAEPPNPELPSAADILAKEETRRRVVDAVSALPEPYRTAVLLRYFEGMPPRKIAKALGVKKDTVATRLKRALHMLRGKLDADYGSRRSWALALVPLALPKVATAAVLTTKTAAVAGALFTMKHLIAGAVLVLVVALGLALGSGPDKEEEGVGVASVDRSDAGGVAVGRTDEGSRPVPVRPFSEPAGPGGSEGPSPSVIAAQAGFRGRLVDPWGRPAAGQLVRVLSLDLMASFGSTSDPMGAAGAAGVRTSDARTADDGTFLVPGLSPGTLHALHAGIDGPHPTIRMLERTPGPAEIVDLGDVMLEQLGAIEGKVVDEGGHPMKGARVWAADLPPALMSLAPIDRLEPEGALLLSLPDIDPSKVKDAAEWHNRVRQHLGKNVVAAGKTSAFVHLDLPPWAQRLLRNLPRAEATTDSEGRFVLNGVPEGPVVVVARVPGRTSGRRTVRVARGETADAGALAVKRGRTFRARVVDTDGQPIAGAEVRVAPRPLIGLTGILFAGRLMRSDAEGHVRETGLLPGRVQVAYRAPGAPTWTVTPPMGTRREAELVLPSGPSARLVVRPSEGRVLEELQIRIQQGPPLGELAQAGMAPRRVLDPALVPSEQRDDGAVAFLLKDLTPGVHTLLVHAKGHAIACATIIAGEDADETTVELAPAAELRLRVVDARGEPVHGARVFVEEPDEPAWARSILWSYAGLRGWSTLGRALGRTGSDGVVTADDLPHGRSFVTVQHPALGTYTETVELPGDALQVTMHDPGSVIGRVWDHGVPASGKNWRVVATRQDGPAESAAPTLPQQAVLDAEGRFRIPGLAPGHWKVEATESLAEYDSFGKILKQATTGFPWLRQDRSVDVIVEAGLESEVAFDVDPSRLPPGTTGCTVRGTVTLGGVPKSRLHVAVGSVGRAKTDSRGAFEISGVRPGKYQVTVRSIGTGVTWWMDDIMLGHEQERELLLDIPTATIEGVVVAADGSPAGNHVLRLRGSHETGGGFLVVYRVETDGRFKLDVPARRMDLSAAGPGGRAARVLTLHPGSVEHLTVELGSAGVLAGRVRTPIEGSVKYLFARRMENGRLMTFGALIDRDGRFAFTDITPGRYSFTIQTDRGDHDTSPRFFDLTEDGKLDLELDLGEKRL